MSHEIVEPSQLLVELRKEFDEQRDDDGPFWEDATVQGDHLIVVYRDRVKSPLIGRRYNVPRLAALFEPAQSASALAETLVSSDFVPPSTGGGKEMDVQWANGLSVDGQRIYWINV
jgi:hypothetical protein